MPADLVILIGLDPPETNELKARVNRPLVAFAMLPKLQLRAGELFVGRSGTWDWKGPVAKVVFHGIFENDLPALAALALWGGPCLPSAHGMLDCRPRIANLARVRRVSRFAALPRGYADPGTTFAAAGPTVAKWGEWHCGEGKERFDGERSATEPTLFEPFVVGEAVRVTVIGERVWQLRLGGDDWKKSIHHPSATFTPVDPELAEDVQRMRDHFDLAVCAADYIVSPDGSKHLLELNHIPNVTEFPEIRAAYLEYAAAWLGEHPPVC
jgi:hypothetical protein